MRAAKKDEELGYLNSLRHLCEDFPQGRITSSETPDFIVQTNGHRVGIEITKIFINDGSRKASIQSVEAARDRITTLARDFAGEMGMPPVSVTLFYNWTLPLHRSKEKDIARAVARSVSDNLPLEGKNADLECSYNSIQPREVDQILINRAHPADTHKWTWMEYSRIHRDAISYIQTKIDSKRTTLPMCLRSCEECWVLVVANSFRASGNIKPDLGSLSHTYDSPFARTYFFDNELGRLTLLRCNS
jgi:hypothetical protein